MRDVANRFYLIAPLALMAGGCAAFGGEQVGSSSAVVQTSMLPASVPYYLNLCGQDEDQQRYRLYSPSALGRWAEGKDDSGRGEDKQTKQAREARERCTHDRKINNGDPITVRLHRVGIGGLARFADDGRCKSGCKRDIAIVLDFNGSQTLQKPIVAFYQRNVAPDGNLQFVNQTIFAQNEWFFRYPPSVRVRLYDVRDDKDRALKANLETVAKGANFIRSYIAGAAIAGPIVDTAIKAADQLIDGPRNRPILDMSFQLFPQQPRGTETASAPAGAPGPGVAPAPGPPLAPAPAPVPAVVASREPAPSDDPLNATEITELQRKLRVDTSGGGVGQLGPKTRAAVAERLPSTKAMAALEPAYNKAVRQFLAGQAPAPAREPKDPVPDPTFGSPIYASQFIVFDETAPGINDCDPAREAKRTAPRTQLGKKLPAYYFVPDGVQGGGARVYAMLPSVALPERLEPCLLETPFVIFSITRENVAVAADVAKRISDLQTKFTADATVSEDAIASLGSAYVDAELALAIDRVENTWRADQLAALLKRLEKQRADNKKLSEDDTAAKPLASASYRYRAYRLIEEYLGCPANDSVRPGYFQELAELLTPLARTARSEAIGIPYLRASDGAKLVCPAPDTPPAPSDTTEPES